MEYREILEQIGRPGPSPLRDALGDSGPVTYYLDGEPLPPVRWSEQARAELGDNPPGRGLVVRDDDLRRSDAGPVQQMVDQIVQRQRKHDAVVLDGLLYARAHRAAAAGWTFMGSTIPEPAPEPMRAEPPELWWSRTLAEDEEGEGGLIMRAGDEYLRERYARPWWPIDELPADAVRLVPDPGTVSR